MTFQLDLNMPARDIHNFIRGNDKVPGAWITINGEVRQHLLLQCVDVTHMQFVAAR